jgi:hypothetical protein
LVPHGTYGRKFPAGVRVRRYLCPQSGQTVSLLPKCLAAHWSGTLAEIEGAVREAGRAGRCWQGSCGAGSAPGGCWCGTTARRSVISAAALEARKALA